MNIPIAHIVFLIVLLFFSAFFSGSEAAVFSLPKTRVRALQKQSASGKLLAKLLSEPRKLLVTILLGNLLVNTASTSFVTSASMKLFGGKGVWYAFVLMSVLLLAIGEILPKVVAFSKSESISRAVIFPVKFFNMIFSPLLLPLTGFADVVVKAVGKRFGRMPGVFSSAELLTAIDLGLRDGELDDYEHGVLSNILEFKQKIVKEIMTPSIEVFSLPVDLSGEELIDQIRKSGFSRVPLYGDSTDDIKGILHVKDLIRMDLKRINHGQKDLSAFLRAPFYVPETTRISDLFKELVQKKMHMALVIDEYGSFVGIVTMEDILEEIIGEIRDAREPRTDLFQLIDSRRIIVHGSLEIDKFNDVFQTDIHDERFETIAGHVIGVIGRIPKEGEVITVGNLRFQIISAEPNRIRKMRIEKL